MYVRRLGAALLVSFLAACAGNGGSLPARIDSPAPAVQPALQPHTTVISVPHFAATFSYAGQTYAYTMVGTNPATSPVTTTVHVDVVPVKISFSNGAVLDASRVAGAVAKSPLFVKAAWSVGTTQFGDAVMRSEFWKYASNTNYHVMLAPPKIHATLSLSVSASDGHESLDSDGKKVGYLDYTWFVEGVEPQTIHKLGIPPSHLTIFVTKSVKVLEPGGYCCYRGYHQAYSQSTPTGTKIWTSAWASITSSSVEVLSHEVAEWMNDPFYNNHVPSWIQPGTTACGGGLLEVGDPVTTTLFRVNGFTLQDIAFFSWFARQNPSIGLSGRYDLRGALTGVASNCTG